MMEFESFSIPQLDLSNEDLATSIRSINYDLAQIVFNMMKLHNYIPEHIYFGNDYFIFKGYENSRISFTVKNLSKHWKFGLWVNSELLFKEDNDRPIVELFCQYDTRINKFKPSRSSLCISMPKSEVMQLLQGNQYVEFYYDMKSMLEFIENHPLLAYSDWECEWWTTRGTNFDLLRSAIKYETHERKEKYLDYIYTKIYSKYAISKVKEFESKDIVDKVFISSPQEGWTSNPRITVRVKFKDKTCYYDMYKCTKEILPQYIIEYSIPPVLDVKTEFGKFNNYEVTLKFMFECDNDWIWFD